MSDQTMSDEEPPRLFASTAVSPLRQALLEGRTEAPTATEIASLRASLEATLVTGSPQGAGSPQGEGSPLRPEETIGSGEGGLARVSEIGARVARGLHAPWVKGGLALLGLGLLGTGAWHLVSRSSGTWGGTASSVHETAPVRESVHAEVGAQEASSFEAADPIPARTPSTSALSTTEPAEPQGNGAVVVHRPHPQPIAVVEPSEGAESPEARVAPESSHDPADEIALLSRAQQRLSREPRAALEIVREHEERFPGGLFAQEREVVRIEALLGLHRFDEAARSAEVFLTQHPTSAHRHRVETLRERALELRDM